MRSQALRRALAAAAVAAALATGALAKDKVPVATGRYQMQLVGQRIGEERFEIFKEKKKYRVESQKTLYWPGPSRQHYELQIDRAFVPQKLEAKLTRTGLSVEAEIKKRGKEWRGEIEGKRFKKHKNDLGRREGVGVEFDSPVSNWVVLRRLSLAPGEERTVELAHLDAEGLITERRSATYARLEDEEIVVAGEPVVASVYQIDTGGPSERLWVEPNGFPVVSETDLPDEGCLKVVMVSLNVRPRAWQ